MKKLPKILLSAVLATTLGMPALYTPFAEPTSAVAATTATGYDSADDVVYVKNGKYIYNWGAREEDCTFLSTYAVGFNSGDYSFEKLSSYAGGTGKSDAPNSALYKALQNFMTSKHTTLTTYEGTKDLYRYTDCVSSNTEYLSSFYLGATYESAWPYGGDPWNREHVWPKSNGLVKGREKEDGADIMTLRAANKNENSSRNNTAYGESSGYYNPNKNGQNIQGDCARTLLYTYTRWGNASKMWTTNSREDGVMENLDVLLKWMEEDPVDTWEMGRNDAVQAITGTRNVFVDYPEYAFLLFGKSVPTDMVTPSGLAKSGTITGGTNTQPDTPSTPSAPETPTDKYTSIATLHSKSAGTSATAKGVVTAVAKAGFIFNDGTGSMYFYTNASKPTVKVGDEVEIFGTTSEFGGAKQFSSSSASYTKKDVDVPAYTAPTPTAWTGSDVDSYNYQVGEYVKLTASVYTSGNYINGKVSGASKNLIALVSPSDEALGSIVLSSTPQEIVITGYTCYLSGGKYVYIIPTSMRLASDVEEEPEIPETPENPEDNTGNEDNQGGENNENPATPPCDMPETPDSSENVIDQLLASCSGSITSGLTTLSLAIGAAIMLLKKKEN